MTSITATQTIISTCEECNMAIATEVIDGIPLCSMCAQFVRATEEYWRAPEPCEYEPEH